MSEREELAKQMAFASRHPNDSSRDADEFWDFTSAGSRDDWLRSADRILAAGWRRIPDPHTDAEIALAQRVSDVIYDREGAAISLTTIMFALRAALTQETDHEAD